MKRFGILLLALLWLLPNCGGKKQVVSQPEQTGPVKVEEQIALDLEDDKEEPLVGRREFPKAGRAVRQRCVFPVWMRLWTRK